MLNKHNWNSEHSNMGELVMGSIESQRYSQGLNIIKEIYNDLTSIITTPTQYLRKTPLTLKMLQNSLKQGLTQDEWEKWVISLAEKKNIFLKIPSKKLSSYTGASWKDIIEDIANATPLNGLTTRSIVDGTMLQSGYYDISAIDKVKITAGAIKTVAVNTTKAVTGTFDFVGKTKYFLLAGGLGFLAYKLMGQSGKISAAYNTIKNDSKVGLGKLNEKAKAGMAAFKAKQNPKKKNRKHGRK